MNSQGIPLNQHGSINPPFIKKETAPPAVPYKIHLAAGKLLLKAANRHAFEIKYRLKFDSYAEKN